MTDTLVIACGDLHSNSTVGLCPPRINLDDGGTYGASRVQRWLWSCWLDQVERVKAIEARRKVLIINGDIGELDTKRRSTQLISSNKAVIQAIVTDTIAPLVDVVTDVVIIRGTMAHTGKGGWLEESIAQDLDHAIRPGKAKSPASWYHMRGVFAGVRFDIAHHVSMGSAPMYEKNAANRASAIALWRYMVDMQQDPPNVLLRSHNHRYADSGGNYKTFAVLLPAWTVKTEFAYRIGAENTIADIGSSLFYCSGGKYVHERLIYKAREERKVWQKL